MYVNSIKSTLRACAIPPDDLEKLAAKKTAWRTTYKGGIEKAEKDRIKRMIAKRMKRKARADLARQAT